MKKFDLWFVWSHGFGLTPTPDSFFVVVCFRCLGLSLLVLESTPHSNGDLLMESNAKERSTGPETKGQSKGNDIQIGNRREEEGRRGERKKKEETRKQKQH